MRSTPGAVPGMAVATQRPPATLTELTWLHQCKDDRRFLRQRQLR